MSEQLHPNPKVDYCLKIMFAINQFDQRVEIYEGAIDSRDKSIRSLEQEGTLTSMRQGCFAFRLNRMEEQMQTAKRQVEFRLNCVGILLVLLILAIIFNDIKDGKLNIALLEAFGLLAAICVIKLRRLLRKKSDDSLNYSLKMPTAEFLLWLLLPREGREAAIGDTNETFEMMTKRFGVRKARFWYWSEVAKSAWPLLCYLGKQLCKWCGFGAIAEFLRRAL